MTVLPDLAPVADPGRLGRPPALPVVDPPGVDDDDRRLPGAQAVRDLGTVPPLASVLEVYDAKVIECADLDEAIWWASRMPTA